jgi:hypothetical protein
MKMKYLMLFLLVVMGLAAAVFVNREAFERRFRPTLETTSTTQAAVDSFARGGAVRINPGEVMALPELSGEPGTGDPKPAFEELLQAEIPPPAPAIPAIPAAPERRPEVATPLVEAPATDSVDELTAIPADILSRRIEQKAKSIVDYLERSLKPEKR